MNGGQVIRRLHEHRMWVNERLVAAVDSLSAEQLHRPMAIGQGSVWRTLTHLLAAEFVWLEALCGNAEGRFPGDVSGQLPGNQQGEGALSSLDELVKRWREVMAKWRTYLARLSDAQLDEMVYRVSTSSRAGVRLGTRRADVLMHVCTHAQYTTSQLVNMLRQLGAAQLPDVMLITMAREENAPIRTA